jgi:hypothetical protein
MQFTIDIGWGWWMIPTAITILAYWWFRYSTKGLNNYANDYGMAGVAYGFLFLLMLVPVLASWLIWSLLT